MSLHLQLLYKSSRMTSLLSVSQEERPPPPRAFERFLVSQFVVKEH